MDKTIEKKKKKEEDAFNDTVGWLTFHLGFRVIFIFI